LVLFPNQKKDIGEGERVEEREGRERANEREREGRGSKREREREPTNWI
jgi:hypothetical protein